MSKKKPRDSKSQGGKRKPDADLPPMDPRSMERMMQDLHRLLEEREFKSEEEISEFLNEFMAAGKPIPSTTPRTPLEQAQELMYEAWETRSRAQRIKLAKEALSISEDCADAYVLLAEESAKTLEEALALYEQGVRAGEQALGPEVFEEEAGSFWGILETRPYMRARLGLAQLLAALGERRKARDHLAEMLRLNPNDNQGIRYHLLDMLLEMGDDAAAEELLNRYKGDHSANWKYNSALLAFRQQGASRQAEGLLKKAFDYNPHVPPYLLGRKLLPAQPPAYISPGDETEAVDYAGDGSSLWRQTDGALMWLRDLFDGRRAKRTS